VERKSKPKFIVVPAAEMVSVRVPVVVCAVGVLESVTSKVSGVELIAVVGVPLITPVDAVNDKPAGNVPEASDQV